MLELRTRLRRLLNRPAYVFSVVLSLGIGTAVSVAAFSFTNALVFRSLPGITDRRDLIRIDWASASTALTTSEFRAIESQQIRSFSAIAAQGVSPLPIVLPSGPETLSVAFVSRRFFETLGTGAVLGRVLTAADGESSAAPVALISERLWRRAFNERGVLEMPLTIAGRSFSIVGVTPDRFSGTRIIDLGARDTDYPDAWICLRDAAFWPATARVQVPWLSVAGRLTPGADVRAVRSEIDVLATRVTSAPLDAAGRRKTFRVYRAGLDWRDEPAQSLLTLALFLFIPLSVLGIGCVNVINLQLARALDESSELSLRLALGASRWRIVRLLLLEVAGMALLSTLLGLAGARMLLLRAGGVAPVPLAVDPVAMAFAALLVTAVVCVTGLLPAWWSSHDVAAAGLRELHGTSKVRTRFRGLLIVIQAAASVALLALSGLAIRSLLTRAPAAPAGAERIVVADFDFSAAPADGRAGPFMTAVLERLRSASSVHAGAFSTFTISAGTVRYRRVSDSVDDHKTAFGGFVTPQWFTVTGATFLAGAPFQVPRGTAVVNRALAYSLTGGRPETAIGMPLRIGADTAVEVTGVVEDTETGSDGRPLPMLILPMPAAPATVSLLVLAGDLAGARQAVRAAVTEVDPTMPLLRLPTLDEKIDEVSSGVRALASAAATLGVLSVALAGVGLHSLLSYAVRRRRREIAVRVALGARSSEIVRLAVGAALWLVLAGAIAGVALAVPIAILIRSVLFGVSPIDPRGLLPSVGILLAVTLFAAARPALQALRIRPMEALRDE